jgi:hypothetical protein
MTISTYSDGEILKRLKDGEDSFVERKSFGDWKSDAVKTCVAFANSCPFDGPPGLLCIGVKDDGRIETIEQNLDALQKTLERELEATYPAIPHSTRIIASQEGRFIAVIIPPSSKGPHFSGPAYIRTGSITIKANEEAFERILDRQERKVREILKWQGERIKLLRVWARPSNLAGRIAGEADVIVRDCTSFNVELMAMNGYNEPIYISLEHIVLGHDPKTGSLTIEAPQD